MKPVVVQKYGGSSVADVEKIRQVAQRIIRTREQGYNVVAVVSAMGGATDRLMAQAREVSAQPKRRELDMLLTVGERITMSLLTMALQDMGHSAISFTGSQCGIITSDSHSNARIIDVRPVRILDELERDQIVIVAGFQGMSYKRDITTLGRGGSDTTAVAIAAAIDAKYCEICSDVDGVYSADPRIEPQATRIDQLSYDEMEVLGEAGAKVLNPDAIEFARQRGLKVMLTATFTDGNGTLLLERAEDIGGTALSVAYRKQAYYLSATLDNTEQRDALLALIAEKKLHCDSFQIQNGPPMRLELFTNPDRVPNWQRFLDAARTVAPTLVARDDAGSLSLVGNGVGADAGNFIRAANALKQNDIRWWMADMARHRISFAVDQDDVTRGVQALHAECIQRPDARRKP